MYVYTCYFIKFHVLVLLFAGDVSNECTSGFLNFSSINETSSMIVALPNSSLSDGDPSSPFSNSLSEFTQWISPNINFTCNGSVIKWRLRVNASIESVNKTIQRPSPHIATWKLDNPTTSSYTLKSITNESQINVIVTNGSIYYEYTPSPPTPVQAGDFIGILLPDVGLLNITPLFLRLPEENSNAISCVRLSDSQQIFLPGRKCLNIFEQQLQYIPLVSVILSELPNGIRVYLNIPYHVFKDCLFLGNVTLSPTSLPPTTTPSSTQSATSMVPTSPTDPKTTSKDTTTGSTTIDSAAPSQSGANSNQLVGVIVGALVAALSLVLIVILAIFLIILLTKRRGQKLYDVPVPPQPQNMDNPVYTGRCRCTSMIPPLHIVCVCVCVCGINWSFFCSLWLSTGVVGSC